MRVRTATILALIAGLASPSVFAAPAPAPKPRARPGGRVVLDRVVAVVNDDIVLLSELERATARHPLLREALSQLPANATQAQIDAQTRQVQIEVLDELIHLVLVRAEAVKFDIKVSEQELQHALGNIAAQNGLTLDELKKQVEASDEFESWAEYSGELKEQLLGLRVSQMLATWSVSEAQIREYYRKMTKDESAKVVVEQFTFAPKTAERADRDQAFAQAQAAGRRLREGESGETLAASLGRNPEDWQRTVGRGDIAPALEDAVFAAKKGAVVGPLASGQGYVVYKIVELLESAALGYEQAKDRIRDQLENEAYLKAETDLREQLRAKAHVDVRL